MAQTSEGLRAKAERIIAEAIETDRREDELYGDRRGDELPDELADPKTRKAKIKELLEQARREREQVEAQRDELPAAHAKHLAQSGKRTHGPPPKPVLHPGQQRLLVGDSLAPGSKPDLRDRTTGPTQF